MHLSAHPVMKSLRSPSSALVAVLSILAGTMLQAQQETFRIVAANLTSGTQQSYSQDNGTHTNPEGAGARMLKGLKPDIVLIQEFNVGDGSKSSLHQWVNRTLGPEFEIAREPGQGIPNGIISRFPIIAEGEWDDPTQSNRDFSWAKIKLPNQKNLWAVSVHFYSQKPGVRNQEAEEVLKRIRANLPAEDLVVLGGDFNTDRRSEPCVQTLGTYFHTGEPYPTDESGDGDTNFSRKKPYDWVLADAELHATEVPVKIGNLVFDHGFVLDTRTFDNLELIAPAQKSDSATQNMQHMAVVRDFSLKK